MNRLSNFFRVFSFFVGIILMLTACSSRPKGVLNSQEMTEMLTDLHKLDGTISIESTKFIHNRENIYYYNALLKKHGVTQAEFDSSLVWYTKNPKKFRKVYDQVMENLTQFENEVKAGKYNFIDSVAMRNTKKDIWRNPISYVLTKESPRNGLRFKIIHSQMLWQDTYILSFVQRIAPQDSSTEKHIVMRIHYTNGVTDSVYTKAYNDSILRRYTLRLKANHKHRIDSITGSLLGCKSYRGEMNGYVDSVKLIRQYDVFAQDSIARIINRLENEVIKHPIFKNR